MSKRQIEAALKRKGLSCAVLSYEQQITPGELVGAWEIQLDKDSENRVLFADPDFDDFEPDCANTADALEWVATLPECSSLSAPGGLDAD